MTSIEDETTARWLRPFRAVAAPRRRLVCFPHAGGAANAFRPWAKLLPPDVELLAVQYPARHDRFGEAGITTMAEMVAAVTAALDPLLDVPVALFGHSMGASIAHETAVWMERHRQRQPAALLVSGREPPHLVHRRSPCLTDDTILAEMRVLGGMAPEFLENTDLQALAMPALRSDFRLVGTYAPAADLCVGAPLTAYLGDTDPHISEQDLRSWSRYTTGPFEMKVFPGSHFYLDQQADRLVADIAQRLG